jgi:hypothetical protein
MPHSPMQNCCAATTGVVQSQRVGSVYLARVVMAAAVGGSQNKPRR